MSEDEFYAFKNCGEFWSSYADSLVDHEDYADSLVDYEEDGGECLDSFAQILVDNMNDGQYLDYCADSF